MKKTTVSHGIIKLIKTIDKRDLKRSQEQGEEVMYIVTDMDDSNIFMVLEKKSQLRMLP